MSHSCWCSIKIALDGVLNTNSWEINNYSEKGEDMQYSIDTHVKEGHLELSNLPFKEGAAVKVVLIPKASLS